MKKGWEEKSIAEIATVKGGKRLPKGYAFENTATAYPYLTVSCFAEDGSINIDEVKYINEKCWSEISRYTISSDDLYISIAGTIGKSGFIPENLDGANLTENACKIILGSEIYKKFLFYYTKSSAFEKSSNANTRITAQPKLSLERLKTILIPVPDIREQRRIVAILDDAFARIDKAIENTEKNIVNAKELFECFLDKYYHYTHKEYSFLSSISKDITDGDHQPPPKSETGIPFITISNINKKMNIIDFSDTFNVNESYYLKLKDNKKPINGDILYTVTGSFGIPVLIKENIKFCFQRHIGLIRPKDAINPHWLYYALRSRFVYKQAENLATGTAQKTVSLRALRSFKIPVVDFKVQSQIVQILSAAENKTTQLLTGYESKLASLQALKQSLLAAAFSGELTADFNPDALEL